MATEFSITKEKNTAVTKCPAARQFHRIFTKSRLPSFLEVLTVSLVMSSDPKNYFVFLVDEISEPGLTIKGYFLTLRTIRRKPKSK